MFFQELTTPFLALPCYWYKIILNDSLDRKCNLSWVQSNTHCTYWEDSQGLQGSWVRPLDVPALQALY